MISTIFPSYNFSGIKFKNKLSFSNYSFFKGFFECILCENKGIKYFRQVDSNKVIKCGIKKNLNDFIFNYTLSKQELINLECFDAIALFKKIYFSNSKINRKKLIFKMYTLYIECNYYIDIFDEKGLLFFSKKILKPYNEILEAIQPDIDDPYAMYTYELTNEQVNLLDVNMYYNDKFSYQISPRYNMFIFNAIHDSLETNKKITKLNINIFSRQKYGIYSSSWLDNKTVFEMKTILNTDNNFLYPYRLDNKQIIDLGLKPFFDINDGDIDVQIVGYHD